MRLLLCIPYFTPAYAFGGSVTVAETIVEGFVAAGHEVTVATTDVFDEHQRLEPGAPGVPGSTVMRFRNVSHRAAAGVNLYLPRGYRRWLREHIREFDAVLLQDVYSAISVGGARAAHEAGVPYVLQPLGTLSPASERGRPLAKRAFLHAWGYRTVREAAALIHSTEFERQDFLDAGARVDQMLRLPLPLDLPQLDPGPKAERPTVISVGRLHAIKRLDVLVEAVAVARRSVPEIRLDIVGPGDQVHRELERQIAGLGLEEAVTVHGFVSADEKFALLSRAHVGALLSASEGLPMAALEYMGCGLPVVLSEGCHLPEADGRAGIVVADGPAAAAHAVVDLLTDSARREALGRGARVFADDFRRDQVVPQMISALEGLAPLRSTSVSSSRA